MKKHQKKRNSLLIYEFLVRTISRGLVEDDKRKSSSALKILKRYYRPGTEVYKEFRLMNALVKTTVSSEAVASSILKETRIAAEALDAVALDREKSLLIRNINHVINDPDFYDQQVDEYKTYATIQSLVNEWRSADKDIALLATFEDQLMKRLLAEKTQKADEPLPTDTPGTARLLMKVMSRKLNEKYSGVLNEQQRSLIKAYAYSTASSDQTPIKMKLKEIRDALLALLDDNAGIENEYMKNKLTSTRDVLIKEDLEHVDDSTVTRFMLYSKLQDELQAKE